jgi:hypothetical protein
MRCWGGDADAAGMPVHALTTMRTVAGKTARRDALAMWVVDFIGFSRGRFG